MATKFQIKRTSIAGRTPNTSNQANSSYIAAGELAVNLTDKKLYSSNGTYHFEVGAFNVQLVNSTSNVSTYTQISTLQFDEDSGFNVSNPSSGIAKVAINSTFKYWQVDGVQKLTATGLDTVNFIAGNNITITANGANTPQSIAFSTSLTPTFTSITVGNSTVNSVVNSTAISVTKIFANGALGSNGQLLASNGTATYWSNSGSGLIRDSFTGNGSNVNFTLSKAPVNEAQTLVFVDRVLQRDADYSLSGTTLTFAGAPDNSAEIDVYISDPALTLAAGSNTNIIFNDSNTTSGSNGFTFNSTTNTVSVSNTLFIGNSTVNTVINSSSISVTGGATFAGHLMPAANVTYDIGNSAVRWRDLWLSGTTINLGGATIQTDANSGAIALVPKPTGANPNPVGVVISPTGGVTTVVTTGGVPAANAVATAATANTATPVPIDITSTAPLNNQALIWSSAANTFVPGNVASGGGSGGASDIPKIVSLVYPGSTTAANTSGGQTIYITGNNFVSNCKVYINNTLVPSITFVSSSNVGFTTPALSINTYPLYLVNPDGGTTVFIPGLDVSSLPTWVTSADLGSFVATQSTTRTLEATSDSTVTYSLAGGSSLPAGLTLAANGVLSGTLTSPPATTTTYNFSVVATDEEFQTATRAFSIAASVYDFTISPSVGGVSNWTFATDGSLILTDPGEYTLTFSATVTKNVKMWGAGGKAASSGASGWGNGGAGGAATGNVSFASGSTYKIRVPAAGATGNAPALAYGAGNAGSGSYGCGSAGSGGGYAGIFLSSVTQGNAILMAGGGGGGAGSRGDCLGGRAGLAGGGTAGQTAPDIYHGPPGTQSAGGSAGGGGTAGSALQGGSGGTAGGGGGGGYYGGGTGINPGADGGGGGGGGSGYYNPSVVSSATLYTGSGTTPGNNSDASRGTAGASGVGGSTPTNGKVVITA